jgi:hypothetical protein
VGAAGFSSVIDLGGGALGSVGQNRFVDYFAGDIELFQTDGTGRFNWWGGITPRVDIYAGGSFAINPELPAYPRP